MGRCAVCHSVCLRFLIRVWDYPSKQFFVFRGKGFPKPKIRKHFMGEHVFEVLGLPVVVAGDLLADALAQLPEGKRDVILLSYFLGMTDREISEKLNIVHQTVSKRRLVTLKELREYLMKEGFEWPDK